MTIFIDTGIFIAENYTKGRKIRTLAKYGNLGYINLKITTVIYQELLSNIKKEAIKSIAILKKSQRDLSSKAKILKNLDSISMAFHRFDLDENECITELTKTFLNFLKYAKIEIVELNSIDLKKLLSRYFGEEFPFSQGKKKSEFPDAITLQIIEKWIRKNNTDIIFLSNDNDIVNLKIDSILTSYDTQLILNKIQKLNGINIDSKESEIIKFLKNFDIKIQEFIGEQMLDQVNYYIHDKIDEIVEDVDVEDIEPLNINTLSFDKLDFLGIDEELKYINFKYSGKITFSAFAFIYNKSDLLNEKKFIERRQGIEFEFEGYFESTLCYSFEYDYTPFDVEFNLLDTVFTDSQELQNSLK